MNTDWIPSKDADLLAFATAFQAAITTAFATYGLATGDQSGLATNVTAFGDAMALLADPATNTTPNVAAKQTARAVLTADLRALARRVQAYGPITAELLANLGLTVRDTSPTRIVPPTSKPLATIANIQSTAHVLNIADENTPAKKARPFGASGAEVFYYVPTAAEDVPTDLTKFTFSGLATKASYTVSYPGTAIGKTSTIRMRWYNRRGEPGPLSDAITATVAA